ARAIRPVLSALLRSPTGIRSCCGQWWMPGLTPSRPYWKENDEYAEFCHVTCICPPRHLSKESKPRQWARLGQSRGENVRGGLLRSEPSNPAETETARKINAQ